jgi:biotin carboxyl carrier protein
MPRYLLTYADQQHEAEVEPVGGGRYTITIDGRCFQVDSCLAEDSVLSLLIDGANHEVHHSRERDRYTLLIDGMHYELQARNRRARSIAAPGTGLVTGRQVVSAPMPGRVVRVLVSAGQRVEAGEALLTLEAMKMENQVRSPVAGEVLELKAREGQTVGTGDKLAVVG